MDSDILLKVRKQAMASMRSMAAQEGELNRKGASTLGLYGFAVERIAELESQLETLASQNEELEGKVGRQKEAISGCRAIFHQYLRKTKQLRLDMLAVEGENRRLRGKVERTTKERDEANRAADSWEDEAVNHLSDAGRYRAALKEIAEHPYDCGNLCMGVAKAALE